MRGGLVAFLSLIDPISQTVTLVFVMHVSWIVATPALMVSALLMVQNGIAEDQPKSVGAEQSAFETVNIVLYNSTKEFEKRSPPPAIMGAFIKRIQFEASKLWTGKEPEVGKSGLIAVAIRPDGTMKFWIDIEQQHEPKISDVLEAKMQSVGVPQVSDGPVAFSINFHLWGGPANAKEGVETVELPQAWKLAAKDAKGQLKVPDQILPLAWKRPVSESDDSDKTVFVPDGFVMEELKPLGGSILRPRAWVFAQQHRRNALMWTISKEDPKDGPYETGVRIQFFAGVQAITGKTPQEFIKSFIDDKRKTSKVIRECPEEQQGIFTRVCLLTEEPSADAKTADQTGKRAFRILYSCFWSDETDMASVSIAGTTPELWDTYENVFDTMAKFELLDLKKIDPAAQ